GSNKASSNKPVSHLSDAPNPKAFSYQLYLPTCTTTNFAHKFFICAAVLYVNAIVDSRLTCGALSCINFEITLIKSDILCLAALIAIILNSGFFSFIACLIYLSELIFLSNTQ